MSITLCFIVILGVMTISFVHSHPTCQTLQSCSGKLSKCKHIYASEGLLKYDGCLSELCEHCSICGICDGHSHTEDVSLEERLQCLTEHNNLRRLHKDTPDVVWDADLARNAQAYADHLANTVDFRHGALGENMFLKMGSNGTTTQSCMQATDAWYQEIKDFSYETYQPNNGKETRHFEQMVWKGNTKVGFGIAVHSETKFVYVIGRYESAPMAGQEKDNILPLKQ